MTLAAVALATLASPVPAEAAAAPTWWKPTKGLSWQWQLSGKLDLTVPAAVYDIDAETVLKPILTDRFTTCKAKGFDGVEPDNVDGYANDPGFPLTAADQLTYNRRVADLAHSLGLAVGLKNDLDQVTALAPAFDFAVNEECAGYGECGVLATFVKAGKPVFHAEYDLATTRFCASTAKLGLSSIRKRLSLNAWRQPC